MSDSPWLHELRQARLPCPSPTPGTHSNSCASSWWCHPAISSSVVPFSACPQSLPVSESTLRMTWPKYWSFSFSISLSNEHSGLIFFRMDWLDFLVVQETLKESSPTPQFKSTNPSRLSILHSPTLTCTHDQQIANIRWIIKKARKFQKTSISALLTMPKPLTVWITRNRGKFWKRWEYQTTWHVSWETYMQIRKQQLKMDMEQQTDSKQEKE